MMETPDQTPFDGSFLENLLPKPPDNEAILQGHYEMGRRFASFYKGMVEGGAPEEVAAIAALDWQYLLTAGMATQSSPDLRVPPRSAEAGYNMP